MAIEAIVTDIELTADEPFRERFFPLENFFEWLEPNQFVLACLAQNFSGERMDSL